jgi:prepilin-type N-terminal cleavage/methylation domain-containing protein
MTRRGLTLLEVLLASALLTLIAAVCVPVLTEARQLMERHQPSIDAVELGVLADTWLDASTPPSERLDALTAPGQRLRLADRNVLVIAHSSTQRSESEDGLWVSFTADGVTTVRWVAIPAAEEARP